MQGGPAFGSGPSMLARFLMGWIPEEGELGSAVLSLIPNPVDFSVRRWLVIGSVTWVFYLWHISTLSRRPRNSPCPDHGIVLRVLYGLFSTWVAEQILAHFLHTKRNEPQAEQVGGTQPVVLGPPQLRIKVVPILGAAFGGNYAYLIWDETDADRRAIVVDPADPYPVLRAAAEEKLNIEVLLTTHWHFDHASGNATFAREIPGLRVIASDREVARVPAATERMHDEQQIRVGSIVVTAHTVPGHTLGSVVYEVSSSALPESPSAAFTGDTLFCGGCGRLFEGSALQLHASLRRLRHRLKPDCQIFSGHEYAEMLLAIAVRSEPGNKAARAKLQKVRDLRAQRRPSVPSSMADELAYNPWMKATPVNLARLCGCGQ